MVKVFRRNKEGKVVRKSLTDALSAKEKRAINEMMRTSGIESNSSCVVGYSTRTTNKNKIIEAKRKMLERIKARNKAN